MATAYQHYSQMAHHYQMQPVLSQQSIFDDDDSVLDDGILGDNMLDSTFDHTDRRRGVDSNAIFSPGADWDFDHDMSLPGPGPEAGPATFEHSHGTNNPFIKLEQAQPAFAQQHNWSGNSASGSCTPTVYDGAFGATFEDSAACFAPAMAAGASAFDNNSHITPLAVFPSGPAPASPAVKDWNQATTADHNEPPMAKRMRAQSPAPRAHSPMAHSIIRRDGIRKKNARFDIPAERTLMNIDTLIARSQDENEIKELKQQKRLLRNRQAALDSRQRKKQHTERLEEEKKLHSAVIQELEEKVNSLALDNEQLQTRFSEVVEHSRNLEHQVETFQMEKEDMVRSHTLETGELRKKNSYLQEQLQRLQEQLERMPQSGQATAGGYTDPFDFESDFDLDNCWDNSPMEMVDVQSVKAEKSADVEKPAAGLLFFLLLCGAFVASSKTSIPSLPPLPKNIQAAGAEVIQNVFQDAGVSASRVSHLAPTPSGDAWAVSKSDVPQMLNLDSTMSALSSFDSKPSAQQQHDSFMQLTPAEYNDITSNEFLREPEPVDVRSRRRIQENLASMKKSSAADVYTRSLLWDKVDAEVVRRFAAFARQAQAQQASSNDDVPIAAGAHS